MGLESMSWAVESNRSGVGGQFCYPCCLSILVPLSLDLITSKIEMVIVDLLSLDLSTKSGIIGHFDEL